MSTAIYLVCDLHREVIKVSHHRAYPLHDTKQPARVAQFCYQHLGCPLRSVNEQSSEPFDYDHFTLKAPNSIEPLGDSDRVVRVRLAVAVWYDDDKGCWDAWGEGGAAHSALPLGSYDAKQGCQYTLADTRMSGDAPIYWRWVEASVPLPELAEPVVTGATVGVEEQQNVEP